MGETWKADPTASLRCRLGRPPHEIAATSGSGGCPDIWELDNGDIAVIGKDMTPAYRSRLPEGVSIVPDERLVVIPRATLLAAKADIPDA